MRRREFIEKTGWRQISGPLFWKYVGLFLAVVCVSLLGHGLFEIIISYREHTDALIRSQREQAEGAAEKIGLFIKEIESQMGWTTHLTWSVSNIEHAAGARHFRVQAARRLREAAAQYVAARQGLAGRRRARLLLFVQKVW
jgi:hypothetical protein